MTSTVSRQIGCARVTRHNRERGFEIVGLCSIDHIPELLAFVAPKEPEGVEAFDIPIDSWFTDNVSMYYKESEFRVGCFDPDGTPVMGVARSALDVGRYKDLGKNPVKAWAEYTAGRACGIVRFCDVPTLTWFMVPRQDCRYLKPQQCSEFAHRYDAQGNYLDVVQINEVRAVMVLGTNPREAWK